MSGGERVCLHRNGVSAHPWSQTFGKSGGGFQSYESSLGELWLVHRRLWERSNLYSIHYTVFTHACIRIQKNMYIYIYRLHSNYCLFKVTSSTPQFEAIFHPTDEPHPIPITIGSKLRHSTFAGRQCHLQPRNR